MGKKIVVAIDKQGRLVTDFDGFQGEDCFAEADELQKKLEELGVKIKVETRKRKPPKVAERQEDSSTQQNSQTRNKH